jgi:hypothetical protein
MQPRELPPIDLEERVSKLVKAAAGGNIDERTVRSYAKLFIAATDSAQRAHAMRQEQEKTIAWLASNDLLTPFATSEWTCAEEQLGKSRSAAQQIGASARATAKKMEHLLDMLQEHLAWLPQDAPGKGGRGKLAYGRQLAKFQEVAFLLNDYARELELWSKKNLLKEHQHFRDNFDPVRSISDLTFFWWYHHGPEERGRSRNRCYLAFLWKLTKTDDPKVFERYVRERRRKMRWNFGPPRWAC